MSLCGGLTSLEGPSEATFRRHLVTFDEFIQNPKIVDDPNLVIKYDGQYYNWRTACPLVMSLVMFQQPLPKVSPFASLKKAACYLNLKF